MKPTTEGLFDHEWQALIEALVRDIRRESEESHQSGEWAQYHRWNAYMVRKVLFHMVGNHEAGLPQDVVCPDSEACAYNTDRCPHAGLY